MKIVKFCKKKHNPFECDEIQIGNLIYYRNHSNRFITDPSEGHFSHEVKSPDGTPTKYSPSDLKRLFGDSVASDSTITVRGFLRKTIIYPNIYIFCTCGIDEPTREMAKQFNEDYDSCYEIINRDRFSQEICALLREKHKSDNIEKIVQIRGQIQYVDRKDKVFKDLQTETADDARHEGLSSIFTKHKESQKHKGVKFENNNEYRFAWLPITSVYRSVNISAEPIFVKAAPLRPFIRRLDFTGVS